MSSLLVVRRLFFGEVWLGQPRWKSEIPFPETVVSVYWAAVVYGVFLHSSQSFSWANIFCW